jgi:hypothetical protein
MAASQRVAMVSGLYAACTSPIGDTREAVIGKRMGNEQVAKGFLTLLGCLQMGAWRLARGCTDVSVSFFVCGRDSYCEPSAV